jgi:hypothetical protein
MRLSDVSPAWGELPARSLAAGDCGGPITAKADQPDVAFRPGQDRPGRDQADPCRSLAERLARLPDAHPSAWPAAARSPAERSCADWAGARPGGGPVSEDTWWRGESGIWWRIPDRPAGEPGYEDDAGGLDDPGELADNDDVTDTDGSADAGWPADADATGESDGQGSGTGERGARRARPAPGAAGPDHGSRDGRPDGTGARPDQSGPDRGPYRPWFSADASGDPWFAAGRQDRADS